jgi:pimeloyl-ACP methyl ester carboxylesterase
MIQKLFYIIILVSLFTSCNSKNQVSENKKNKSITMTDSINFKSGYSEINGLRMYYEIYGEGEPLVLIHGGGSTIQSSFGRIIPQLAKDNKVIAVELQNHGRSGFRNVPETFEQDADDVAMLLKNIGVRKASFFGFSNGGHTAIEINIRHPEIVNKLVIASSPYKRNGFVPGFFDGLQQATLANMPHGLKTAFLEVNPDTARLQIMFDRDRERMIEFKGWSDQQIKSITAPTLLINGDADVITPEHAVEMYRLIPNCQLAILPGGHGKYMGEITTLGNDNRDTIFIIPMIEEFLNNQSKK